MDVIRRESGKSSIKRRKSVRHSSYVTKRYLISLSYPGMCNYAAERCICSSMKRSLVDLPSLSSPKFPQPIFLPTRKLGPTIRTPEDEVTECLDVCIALLPPTPRPPTAPVALQSRKHTLTTETSNT